MKTMRLYSALLLTLLQSTAQAVDLKTFDQIQEKRRQLEAEEQSINRLYQNNDELSQRVGLIRHVQEKVLKGQGGVLERTSQWFAKADNWLAQWKSLVKSASNIKSTEVEQASKTFEEGFQALDDSFSKLVKESSDIREIIKQVRSELEQKDPLPEALNASNRQHISALNLQQKKIIDFLTKVDAAYAQNSEVRFEDQITKIRDYLTLQLRNMRLNFPELREAIERTEKRIAYVSAFETVYGDFRRETTQVEGMVADLRLFEAEASLKKLATRKEQIKKKLASQNITGVLLTDSYRLIDQAFERVDSYFKTIDAEMPRNLSFYSHVDMQRTILSEDCRDPKLRPLRDCELLAVLNRVKFDLDKMDSWTNGDMAYFEQQLQKVRKGPGLGQAVR